MLAYALLWLVELPAFAASFSEQQCGPSTLGQAPFGASRASPPSCSASLAEAVGPRPSRWSPWTHRPYCAGSAYCVFSNSMFRGSGISFVAAPDVMSGFLDDVEDAFVAASHQDYPYKRNSSDPTTSTRPYALRLEDMPGKGKGLVATGARIPRGEVLMTDYAVAMVEERLGVVTDLQAQLLLAAAIGQLPDPQAVLSLARGGGKGAVLGVAEDVLRTNSFRVEMHGHKYMALFPRVARINHACKPNAHIRFSRRSLSMTVTTIRDIELGEEITISYAEVGTTHSQRQHTLLKNWGFQCSCSLCTAPAKEIAASDERRRRIGEIGAGIAGVIGQRQLRRAVAMAEEMMGLVQEEGLAAHLADHYEVLARLHAALGNRKKATKYARLAVTDLERYGGADERDESLREMKKILGK